MRIIVPAVAAVLLSAMPAFADKLPGSYRVEGTNPGGDGAYKGSVTVEQTADAIYRVTWKVGGDTFVGTGIGGDEGLAVSYKSGGDTGVAIFQMKPDGEVDGVWTYAGGKKIGTETWTPR